MVGVVDPIADRASEVTLARLEDQISWYDRKSAISRRWHYRLKVATLISAGVIPITAAVGSPSYIAAALGVFVVVFEGVQQLFQFHQNWVSYRGTCESLKHEKYLYFALAGAYANADRPLRLLAERIEGLVSTENTKWIAEETRSQKNEESRK
jgi:hypothetical protein